LLASAAVIALFGHVRRHHQGTIIACGAARALLILLVVQFTLGVTAYFVTLDDAGMLQPTNLQVVVNTAHMVTGALLMSSAVIVLLDGFRLPTSEIERVRKAESVILERQTAGR
jgi:cytochrome c oxidase assembly protein subunit 15